MDKSIDGKIRAQVTELSQSNNSGNTVISFGLDETQIERYIGFQLTIISGEEVAGVTIKVPFIMADRDSLAVHLLSVRRCVLRLSLSPDSEASTNLADACIRAVVYLELSTPQ